MKKNLQKLLFIAAMLLVPWVTQGQGFSYTCNFDSDSDTAGWVFVNGSQVNQWFIGTATHNSGTKSLYISNNNGTSNSYTNSSITFVYAYQEFTLNAGVYAISYDWKANGEDNYDYIRVFLAPSSLSLTAGHDPSGGTSAYNWRNTAFSTGCIGLCGADKLNQQTSWQNFVTEFTVPTAGTYRLVFAWANDGSDGTTPPGAIDNIMFRQPTCPRPDDMHFANITHTSFDFSWSEIGSAATWIVEIDSASTNLVSDVVYDTNYSATGLTGNNTYTVRVAALCDITDTSMWLVSSFHTPCSFIDSLPYQNGFENDPYYSSVVYAQAFPTCWTRINDATGRSNYYPYITTTANYVHSGTKGMYWYHTTTTSYADNMYAVLPGIDTTVYNMSDLYLSFYAKTTSTSYHPQPIVGVMTDPTDASTFTPVHTFSSTDITTTWQLFAIPLANFTGYGNYIAIKWARPSSSCYMAIDDIFVTNEWCNPPQNVTATSTLEEVTISWTGSDDYSYRVILNDDTVTGITDHFYTFANLTPNTQYEYSVATECASSTSLNLSGSIRTRCYLLDSVPYTMGFEASEGVNTGSTTSNDFVNCWFHLNNATDYFGYPYVASSSSYNHTPGGSRGLYWYLTTTTGTYGDYQIVVLPGVDTNIYPTTTLQLSFWARASSASYYPTFTVGVMTDPNDINTFVLVDTVNIGNSTAWNEYTTSLASYNGSGNYVALRADRPTSSWYAYVDDITLEMIPDCPHVENIAAHSITTNSAELSWHETGSATNWEITYLSDGTPSDLAVTMSVTDTNATLTGLQPNTHYYVWITPICPGYVRPQFISFRTNCNFLDSLPYSMSFESWEGVSTGSSSNPNFANCWHRLNNGTSYFGYPYVNSSGNYNHTPNGVQGLYWYNSTTLNTYGDYQVVVLPAVDIYQYPLRTLQLSFWARSTSTSYYPVFTVGVMSDPNDINTFVAVDTIHVDNSTAWGEYITSLESYSGNGTFVALRADRTSAYWYACVDDITLSVRSCGLHANRLPYFDNFDNYTVSTTAKTGVEPPCWTLVHQDVAMTDEYKPMLYYNPDNAHSGDYSLLLNKRGIYAMPYIDTNINNLKLSFYLKQQQTKYQLQVGVMSDLNDPNTFEPFTTIDNSSTNVEFVEVDFSSYTGDGHYIAFHNILAPGYNGDYSCNYIDDLTLYLPSYTVTANTSEGGFVTGAGTYFKGSTCSLSAIADSGFAFLNWTCGNQVVSTQTEYIFTVSSDTTLTANFARTYTINATVYPEGAGTVYGTGTYIEGSTYTLTAIPNEGYVFFDYDRYPHAGCNFRLSNTLQEEANSDIEYTAFYLIAHQTDVPDNVPTDGLIAYYPFENNADDYSGNNHHGLMYEDVEYQPQPTQDRFGNDNSAYLFNDNFIQVPLANPLFDSCVTVSFWVQQSLSDTAITTYGGDGNRINMYSAIIDGQIDVGSSGEGGSGLSIYLSKRDSANAEVQKIQYGSLNPAINCYTVPKWIHYVIVADSNRRSIYRNGSLVADTTSLQLPTHDGDIYFGATRDIKSCYPYYNTFYGKIDDIALYNRALSAEEVLSLYGDYTDTNILYVFDTIIALGSIVWHGNIYSESGDYIYGCDTVYHLHLTIHDGCTIQSLPYFDNFDLYTTSTTAKTSVKPACWTLARQDVAIADEYKPMIYYNAENTHSGDYSLILNKRGIYAMPYLDANISDVKMSFYLKQQQTKYRLQVGVMSDLWDFSTYVPVTTINNSSTDIEFVRVDFSSYTGNGHYIAFRNILPAGNNGDYSINYIDDLTLYTCPTGTYYDTQVLGSYTWHDTSYSASGLYTYDYVDRYGCPITDTLHLTVCPALSGTAHYSDASVFVQGLNVPHDMLFDTLGNMYVVNHGYNGAYDSLQYTITRIDTAGNIRIVGTDLVFASGMVIDKEQSLYVNQGNGSLNITKIPYGGSQYVWTNLDIQSNTLALFDDGNPDHFRLYAAASWGGGLRVIDHDGNYSSFGNFNRAFILGLSEDGEYLYFDTWNDNEETSTIYRYTYSENTFTPMSGSIFRGVGEWGGIGPDNKCYFTAYSRSNPDNKALYRIDGIESFTEIISDLPGNSEVRAPLWKQNGNTYDLYLGEVVNSNRPNPDDNRIIKFTSLGNYYDWKDTIIVTVCGETEYTWPVNGMTYTENGSYYYHTQTPDGCDSMVILNLFFGGSDTSETIVSEKHFTWHDTTYTESGVYTFGHENEYGCPVTDTLFLTIYNCPKGISDTITATDSYTWHNQSYTESGIYTFLGYVYYEDSIYQINDIPADAVYYCPIIDTLYLTICNIRIADLPYTDDFDSYTSSTTAKTGVEPNCWTLVHQDVTMSDEYKPMIYYNSDNAHSGDYSLLLNKRGIYAMPIIDTNISDIKLSFYLRQQQTKYRLQVGVIDNLEDPNTFVPVTTIDNSSTNVEYVEVDFSSYTGDGHYIAFRNILAPGYNGDFSCNYIDDLTLSVNYTVTTEVYPANGGMVTGGGTYPAGSTCTMTATAADGYNFLYWTDGSNIVSNQDTYNFIVSSNITLTAVFYVIGSQNHYCPGLKNPMSFTSGATSGAYVGFYSGQTGQKPWQAPDALTGATGVSMYSGIIPANQLANTSDNGSSSYCGDNLEPSKQFRIMSNTDGPSIGGNVGKDPSVNYVLPYTPMSLNPTITRSIRLGNCQVSAHAEALYYTMDVRVQNAILSIYYAIVAQAPGHGIEGDPSFVVRVTRRNASNQWQQISDTLFYTVSSYNISDGIDGWHRDGHGYGYVYYHDWDKINIDLSKYLYEQVRIEFYMSDCSASGHYGYCYIAGDCQPMEISIDGCHSGNTQEVATLSAPAGLTNYVWYKCNRQYIGNPYLIPDTIGFTQLTPDSNTHNTYTCTLDDFLVTEGENAGQLTNDMVFRCDITSALDPDKPYVTTHYARVIDTSHIVICSLYVADLPYTDNFDTYTASTSAKTSVEPTCWTLVHQDVTMTDEYKPMIYYNSDNARSGDYSLLLNKRGIYAMPYIDINIHDIKLSFYLRQQQTKYQLQVGVMSDLNDVNTFVPVTTINNSSTNMEYVEINFSSYTGDGHYIAFRNILASGYTGDFSCNYIDDLTLSVNYTVTTVINPANCGTVTGAGDYPKGDTCTVIATPANGYRFLNWTNGNAIVSYDAIYSFTVSSNITLIAVFDINSQTSDCRGFHNPTTFNTPVSAFGSWSARVGDRVQSTGGSTGSNILSTCSQPNKTPIVGHSNITSAVYYSGYCQHRCGSCNHCNIYDGHDRRFSIYTSADQGIDMFTLHSYGQGMLRIPEGHTTSIRLGDMRATGLCVNDINSNGNDKGSEALFYTTLVTPKNAIFLIDYAVVACRYNHTPQQAGEFNIRVCGKNNSTGQWNNYPLNDNLWYTIPAPCIDGPLPAPWIEGFSDGPAGATTCAYCYKPWSRVAINLTDYLYDSVRIEFYTSDCIYNVDPLYAYIAGDCLQLNLNLTYSSCHAGATQEVATLTAPAGLLAYKWYKCNVDGQSIDNPSYIPDTVGFTELCTTSSNTYTCTLDDFMVTEGENAGQLTNNMVFRCDIISALDPDKPYVTTIYARVNNTKPVMAIDTIQSCGGNITLTNRSYVPHETDGCDTTATQWWFYHNGRVDTATGASTSYQFDNSGVYNIKVRSFSRDDHSCYADSTYTVNIIHNTGTFTSITVNTTTPYTWHNQTYDATGTYTFDYTDSNGCPSTDTLHLTIQNDCGIQISDLPYTDNFDHYTASTTAKTGVEPDCWTLVHQDVAMTDEYKPMVYYNSSNAHSGSYALILNKRGIYAMPAYEGDISSLQLQFYLKQTQSKYQLQVGVISDLNDHTTFVPVATFNNTSTTASVLRTVDFASYTGDGHYIAFRNILASGYNGDYSCNYIDDITLTANSPVCSIGLSDLPYTDNFDHYTTSTTAKTGVEPPCWTLAYQNVSMTDEYKPMIYYSASNAHSGRYSLILNKRGIYAMPEFEGNVNTLQLSFYLKQTQAKYQLQVGVMSDLSDPSSFIPVATINNSSTTASVLNTVNFSSYTGNGHYIVFKNILASGYTGEFSCNNIDDLVLEIRQDPCVLGVSDLPYTDNFDSYTSSTTAKTGVEPPCWTLAYQNVSMTDEYKPMIYYSASNAHSGRYSLILNKRGIYAMPEFEGNVNTLQLSFFLKQTQAKYQLQVGVMSDLSDPSSFIPVATINNSSTTASVLNTVNFSSYTGNGHYIVFKNILAPGNTGDFSCNYIDDLTLSVAGAKNTFDDDSYTDNRHRLTLYPNPTTGKLTVEADEEVVRVDVFDYTGRNVAVFESQTTLDLSRLAAGIYTLRVTLPERIEVRRVVKQ